mgnify:CR=1 FL=1
MRKEKPPAFAGGFLFGDCQRIHLARTSVGTRQIANAAEFATLLDNLGFVTFDLADLSIAAQREILADAELLLGADGSHLLGLYFAANSVQELIDQMQMFGEEVMPKVK